MFQIHQAHNSVIIMLNDYIEVELYYDCVILTDIINEVFSTLTWQEFTNKYGVVD